MKGRGWAESESVRGEEAERWYKKRRRRRGDGINTTTAVAYTMQTFGSVSNTCRHVQSPLQSTFCWYIVNNPYFNFVIVCCIRVGTHRSGPGTQLILIVNIRSLPTRTLTNNTTNWVSTIEGLRTRVD